MTDEERELLHKLDTDLVEISDRLADVENIADVANKTIEHCGAIRERLETIRDELAADRRRDDDRFRGLEDWLRKVDGKAGALVVERTTTDPDTGEESTEVEARPAGIGRLGTLLGAVTVLTPIAVAALEVFGK